VLTLGPAVGKPGCLVDALGDLSLLEKRDTTFVMVSRAPLAMLGAYLLYTTASLFTAHPVTAIAAAVVLSLVPVLASGWRYHGAPRLPITLGVGLFAGVSAGAVLIAGPPVILYWLGGGSSAKTLRANLMVFFMICDIILVAIYGYANLFEARPLALSVLLGIPYLLGMGIGSHFFHGASEQLYRGIAYVIISLAALVSLPLFDSILR
jgi:uncharacterized membrane protein YfcA